MAELRIHTESRQAQAGCNFINFAVDRIKIAALQQLLLRPRPRAQPVQFILVRADRNGLIELVELAFRLKQIGKGAGQIGAHCQGFVHSRMLVQVPDADFGMPLDTAGIRNNRPC